MASIRPFRALRPQRDKAAQVSANPFDSNARHQSLLEIQQNPYSYLHVVKPHLHFENEKKNPEKHFPIGLDYLKKLIQEGHLIKDEQACFYIYRIIKGSTAYTTLVASASVNDYRNDVILKHENTLSEKQKELAHHIDFFSSLGVPVLLTYPDEQGIDTFLNRIMQQQKPEYNFFSSDQIKHNVWIIQKEEDIQTISAMFEQIPHLYIADGHHRSASSDAYCALMESRHPNAPTDAAFRYFPVCLIPFHKLQIFEYHRLIKDAETVNSIDLLKNIGLYFDIIPSGDIPVQPLEKGEFGIYFNHSAYLLRLKDKFKQHLDGILEQLDVSIVEEFLLKKVFRISDSRNDKRLAFIDGSKGMLTLEELIDSGQFDLAITLYPTSVDELKNIADQRLIMPPKSTWIEPKVRTGLLIYETRDNGLA